MRVEKEEVDRLNRRGNAAPPTELGGEGTCADKQKIAGKIHSLRKGTREEQLWNSESGAGKPWVSGREGEGRGTEV